MLWVIALLVVVYFLYRKITEVYTYWHDRGVLFIKPTFPLGNMTKLFRKSVGELSEELYYKYPDARYVGVYQFLTPAIMIRDPELLKKVTIKDFDSFANHWNFIKEDIDPLWGSNLFNMPIEKWREMRPTLSPAFTSNKLKNMFGLIDDCSKQVITYLQSQKTGPIEWEMKNFFTRFTNDVIATTAFGIKCDSLKEQDNAFFKMGQQVSNLSGPRIIKIFICAKIPFLSKIMDLKMIQAKVSDYFSSIIADTLAARRKNNIVRPDMINLLLEAQKNRLQENAASETKRLQISDFDITANALIFFLAGFDSVATVMTFLSYELAINPEIQERLFQEVETTFQKCGGNLTYDAVLGMKYLDMVVTETLRKWPPVFIGDRKCIKDYVIEAENADERTVTIPKGTFIMIPSYAIHHDPKHYENPWKFDPERYSEENKHKINPGTYLPFGIGPRICIGSRFALMEVKIIVCHLLKHFELVPNKKTSIPLVLSKTAGTVTGKDGIWMEIKRRN